MKVLIAIIALIALGVMYRVTVLSESSSSPQNVPLPGEEQASVIDNLPPPTNEPVVSPKEAIDSVPNSAAEEIGLITDPNLIAEIERDMQFSPPPEGDVSYMSPEAETVQIEEPFPGEKPDPNMVLPGNQVVYPDAGENVIGKPLDPKTKMEDSGK